jgi:hypothetical protein
MKIGIEIEIETPVGYLNRNRYFQFRFRFDSQKCHSEKVHRVRLVDVDRYVQHKTFPCTHYPYNLPRYLYEYVLLPYLSMVLLIIYPQGNITTLARINICTSLWLNKKCKPQVNYEIRI